MEEIVMVKRKHKYIMHDNSYAFLEEISPRHLKVYIDNLCFSIKTTGIDEDHYYLYGILEAIYIVYSKMLTFRH